jgi:DNA polymerase-3 subunit alpha
MSDIKQVSFYGRMQRMGLQVLARCEWIVLTSINYAVLGMVLKRSGFWAAATIVENRKDGKYKSILI